MIYIISFINKYVLLTPAVCYERFVYLENERFVDLKNVRFVYGGRLKVLIAL